jgi:hypothetical protein
MASTAPNGASCLPGQFTSLTMGVIIKGKHKHYILDEAKIKRAQKLLSIATETETIERALDEVIAEYERKARAEQAHKRFLKAAVRGEIEIRDVYGVLEA